MIDRRTLTALILITLGTLPACDDDDNRSSLALLKAVAGTVEINISGAMTEGLPVDRDITLFFSSPLNRSTVVPSVRLLRGSEVIAVSVDVGSDGRTIVLHTQGLLSANTTYTIDISAALKGSDGAAFSPVSFLFKTAPSALTITAAAIAGEDILSRGRIAGVPRRLSLQLQFSAPVDAASLEQATILDGPGEIALDFKYENDNQSVEITSQELEYLSRFQFRILKSLEGADGETFAGFSKTLYTEVDESPKFPVVSDEELLTLVQRQTFRYFWDFAHPVSGMARERNSSGDIVTSGGSGFGIMALIVGVERGFISRDDALQRMAMILSFLENADRFHGAWPHWLNGNTGDVVPFSVNDNGGDLVETSFLIQGLLTFRQYLDEQVPSEKALVDRINILWDSVEWDWYTREGQSVLYWHWSPDKQWAMNHPIRGYNEALITYFLAASSPSHPVDAAVYHQGWAGGGTIVNGRSFYGIPLPLGMDYGGPLFFAHYSFLGLDPRGLQDTYANYWTQNVNHSRINQAYCIDNPRDYVGYSDDNWGLTASDSHGGYSAHSPTNDLGVITPTAALSSMPYTPAESMKALHFFYYTLGDRLWGPYGFYDAFNITESWTADSYLAIDEGPIIVMIENHRTGLLWDLFMSSPEVAIAMDKLGFTN